MKFTLASSGLGTIITHALVNEEGTYTVSTPYITVPNQTIDSCGVWRCPLLGYGEEGGDIQRGTEGGATALLLREADNVHGHVQVRFLILLLHPGLLQAGGERGVQLPGEVPDGAERRDTVAVGVPGSGLKLFSSFLHPSSRCPGMWFSPLMRSILSVSALKRTRTPCSYTAPSLARWCTPCRSSSHQNGFPNACRYSGFKEVVRMVALPDKPSVISLIDADKVVGHSHSHFHQLICQHYLCFDPLLIYSGKPNRHQHTEVPQEHQFLGRQLLISRNLAQYAATLLCTIAPCCNVYKDGRYGLSAPATGGMEMLDLRTGRVCKTLIPKVPEPPPPWLRWPRASSMCRPCSTPPTSTSSTTTGDARVPSAMFPVDVRQSERSVAAMAR